MLRVYYDKPIGKVKYHEPEQTFDCEIFECNGLFAITYKRNTLVSIAIDEQHFLNCLGCGKYTKGRENLYADFTDWQLIMGNNTGMKIAKCLSKKYGSNWKYTTIIKIKGGNQQ